MEKKGYKFNTEEEVLLAEISIKSSIDNVIVNRYNTPENGWVMEYETGYESVLGEPVVLYYITGSF
jgi:hypothetical protein